MAIERRLDIRLIVTVAITSIELAKLLRVAYIFNVIVMEPAVFVHF